MIAVQDRADTRAAGPMDGLDQPSTACPSAALLPSSSRTMIKHDPVQRARRVRKVTGSAALLDDEASDKLLLDSGTPPGRRRATVARRKLCGGVY